MITREEYEAIVDEHGIQVIILNYLNLHAAPDVFAIAVPNAGRRSLRTGARMKAEGLTPGAADICVLLPRARVAWMETKTRKGRQSDVQKGFEARCKRLGHAYCVVRTLSEAITYMRKIGALR